jgi:hypothetical protein
LERQDAIDAFEERNHRRLRCPQYDKEKEHVKTMMMVNDILEGMVAERSSPSHHRRQGSSGWPQSG